MYVCMYVRKWIHLYVYLYVNKSMHVYYYVYDCIWRCICANVSVYSTCVYSISETAYEWYMYLMYLYVYASVKYMFMCRYVCMYVRMNVWMYGGVYGCLYVCVRGLAALSHQSLFPCNLVIGTARNEAECRAYPSPRKRLGRQANNSSAH